VAGFAPGRLAVDRGRRGDPGPAGLEAARNPLTASDPNQRRAQRLV